MRSNRRRSKSNFNRNAARALDASIGTASTAVRAAYGGYTATQFTGPDGLKDVQVIYEQSELDNLAGISAIPIRANNGSIIRVGDIVDLQSVPAPPLIIRLERRNVVLHRRERDPGCDALERHSRLRAAPARTATCRPTSRYHRWPAATKQASQPIRRTEMSISLLLSILLVYLLMVALYNSYVTPFIVMFTVPVAVVGAFGALALTRQTLNLFSLIGCDHAGRLGGEERHLARRLSRINSATVGCRKSTRSSRARITGSVRSS